jgi:murein L,D-transpeptidase YcbB/YkuD
MQTLLDADSSELVRSAVWHDVQRFYELRDGRPAWINRRGPSSAASDALAAIERASGHGLPDAYRRADLEATRDAIAEFDGTDDALAAQLAAFEVGITSSLLEVGRDVAIGRTRPPVATWESRSDDPTLDLAAGLSSAGRRLEVWLDGQAPRHPQYRALQTALSALRPTADDADVSERMRLISLNMERWRWMPAELGPNHVLVNVPRFEVAVYEDGRPALSMPVVVGARATRTPIFSGRLETVVFSPYWNIPESIAVGETSVTASEDLDYLRRNGIEVLDAATRLPIDPESVDWEDREAVRRLALRQRPGAANALGHVKFLFPNPHNVYMHDTPADALFERDIRALSHGCIRLQDPAAMARYLLRDAAEWSDERIDRAMRSGEEQHVRLETPLPVHVAYLTAWVNEQGVLELFRDVYGYDTKPKR